MACPERYCFLPSVIVFAADRPSAGQWETCCRGFVLASFHIAQYGRDFVGDVSLSASKMRVWPRDV